MTDFKMRQISERIIEVGAKTTETGNYVLEHRHVEDLICEEEYQENLFAISEHLLTVYGNIVAEADITDNNELDCIFFLDYCPNYIWLEEEREDMEESHRCTEEEWDAHWKDVPDSYWKTESSNKS